MAAVHTIETMENLSDHLVYVGQPYKNKGETDPEKMFYQMLRFLTVKIHKEDNALYFYRVREAIASKVVQFHHIPSVINPTDILSKHWGYNQIWNVLKPILFWEGNNYYLIKK